jgi:hypothetical protein
MAISSADAIQQLYIAYFNRPADPLGQTHWVSMIPANGDLSAISKSFFGSAEYTATYGGKTNAQVVDALYFNLFGRHAANNEAVFWASRVDAGLTTIDQLALTILQNAQGTDAVAISSKLSAANQFDTTVLTTPQGVAGYAGTDANAIAKSWLVNVVDATTLAAAVAALPTTVQSAVNAGILAITPSTTFTLTAGVDNLPGTAGNDVFNGVIGGTNPTLSVLDSINGGSGGLDTLNVTDIAGGTALPAGLSVNHVGIVNVVSVAGVGNGVTAFDTSGFVGTNNVNIIKSNGADFIKAGAGQAVSVVDTAGFVTVVGGNTQTVTTAGGVGLSGATGAIMVTDASQGGAVTSIIDGTTVNLTSTSAVSGGSITIGSATHAPSGAVTVIQNLAPATSGAITGGLITVNGGTTVSVTQNAAQPVLATAGANVTTTQSAVVVNGGAATTSVTINQTAAVAPVATVLPVTGVTETGSAVFVALTNGQTLTVDGLTFTAGAAGTTAAQTAAAFANLVAGTTQGNSTLGTYSGVSAGNWSSGPVTGTGSTTVLFTDATGGGNVTDLAFTGTGTGPTITEVQGVTSVTGTGRGGIANGAVQITDANFGTATPNTIASVTENGYASGFIKSNALSTLSLANSSGATVSVYDTTATTLALTVNKLGTASALNLDVGGATYTTLNVTTATANSKLNVTGAAVQALTVAGTNALDLSGSTFSALKTVVVSGAAGVTLNASGATVTDVNAATSSGANTFTVDASKATYEGGSGVDTLTITGAVSKAISLGAGNDTVILAAGTTSLGAVVDGGTGTDTLVMVAADAVTASGSAAFATKAINFEVLGLTGGTGAQLVHVDVLGNYNSVTTGGEAAAGVLTMDGFTSGGTLTLTSASTGSYVVSSAAFATPTTDVFNIGVSNAAGIAAGSVTANKIETINLSSMDTTATHAAGTNTNILTLSADSVTKIVVTGNANLTLNGANATVALVDASGMTGGLTYTAAGTTAETIKGGASANVLSAAVGATTADVLIGGAGADTLIANAGLDTLTGGAGADTFVIAVASSNLNTYATITDASVGDFIKFGGATSTSFTASQLSLASTAVFQDYANAAIHNTAAGAISWFQYGGNTYVIENESNGTSFVNGTDFIVKLSGAVDLSHTSLNTTSHTLLIG